MLRIVLADDNHLTLQQLNDIFAELSELAVVVGQATDGCQALTLIQAERPDVALLDIEMPGLSGIEVASIVSRELPQIKLLALSNYDNFSYLREMMRAGAEAYILKHELSAALLREQLKQLDKSQQQKAEDSQRDAYLSLVAKQSFLSALLQDSPTAPDYKSLMLTQDEFAAPLQALVALQLTNYASLYRQLSQKQPGQLSQIILNVCGSIFMTIKNGVITPTEKSEFAVLFALQPSVSDTVAARQLQEYITLIQINLKRLLNVECIMESSLIHSGTQTLSQRYRLLSQRLGQRSFSSFTLTPTYNLALPHQRNLLTALEQNDLQLCRQVIGELFSSFSRQDNPAGLREMLNDLLGFCQRYFDEQQSGQTFHQFCEQLEAERSMDNLPKLVEEFLVAYLEQQSLEGNHHLSPPVQKTLIYLQGHYQEDISLTTAAEAVGVSVVYLSKIFKAETGISFVDHLTSLRISKAKELLTEPHLSIKEICRQVGFNGCNYFIKVFRERIGKTPAQYRSTAHTR